MIPEFNASGVLKKLALSSLQAELASVNALLARHTENEDPVGWYQFSERKRELEGEILLISETEVSRG